MKKHYYTAAMAALALLCCYLFYSNARLREKNIDDALMAEAQAMELPTEKTEEPEESVMFYICGEVEKPEVYTLPKGSRIIDAIKTAGGATENAEFALMESIASEIKDGQKIYVPNATDNIDKIKYMNNNNRENINYSSPKDPNVVININTAGIDELSMIPGVGEATAKLILDYRNENGAFVSIEDIMNVPRIGEKTFESIKKNITVD